jgi:hypothetical protein
MSMTNPALRLSTTIAFTFADVARDDAAFVSARRLSFESGTEPSVDVVVGDAASVQRVFATRAKHPARIAVVVGGGFVDCVACLVHVADDRGAARVVRLLASLTSLRASRVAHLDGADLRAAVTHGGIAGFVRRRHARTMEEALCELRASLDGRRVQSACVVFDLGHTSDCLDQADAALHELVDDDATMTCALRPPRRPGALPGFTIFATV